MAASESSESNPIDRRFIFPCYTWTSKHFTSPVKLAIFWTPSRTTGPDPGRKDYCLQIIENSILKDQTYSECGMFLFEQMHAYARKEDRISGSIMKILIDEKIDKCIFVALDLKYNDVTFQIFTKPPTDIVRFSWTFFDYSAEFNIRKRGIPVDNEPYFFEEQDCFELIFKEQMENGIEKIIRHCSKYFFELWILFMHNARKRQLTECYGFTAGSNSGQKYQFILMNGGNHFTETIYPPGCSSIERNI